MNVPVNLKPLQGRLPLRLPVLGENALIATIAIGFLLLHILTGVLLIKPSAAPPTPEQDMRSSFGD